MSEYINHYDSCNCLWSEKGEQNAVTACKGCGQPVKPYASEKIEDPLPHTLCGNSDEN